MSLKHLIYYSSFQFVILKAALRIFLNTTLIFGDFLLFQEESLTAYYPFELGDFKMDVALS